MKTHTWQEIKDRRFSREEQARLRTEALRELDEMDLRTVREMAGKTQVEVAALTEQTQSELSRTERREDHRLSTLRRYVEALGGELEVVAVFADRSVRLRGV